MDGKNKAVKANTGAMIKASFWYTLSGFLSKATVFLTTPFFTRLLTKNQYGDFTVFASWQMIMLAVCGLEVYATINRARFDFSDPDEFNGYITSSLVLSTAFTAVVFALYLLFPKAFQSVFKLDGKYIVFMFFYVLTCPAFSMFQAKQRIEYRYKLNALITFVLVIGSTGLSVILALQLKADSLWGRILGQYGLYIAAGLIFYIGFLMKSVSIKSKYIKYALRLSVPLVFSYLGSSVLLFSDNLIVKHMCSGVQVSYLSVTHTCAQIILLLVQLLNGAWAPWFYDKLRERAYVDIRKTFRAYVWIVISGTLAVILFVPEIIAILGGKNYLEAIYIVPVYVLNGVFSVLTYQFGNLETYYKKPEYSAMITGCVAVVNIVLDVAGVKLFGYRAVCYATLLCQILLVTLHFMCTRKMEIEKILPLRDVITFVAASVVLIPIALLLYQNNVVRWGIIGALVVAVGIVAGVKRREIMGIVKRFGKSSR